MIQLFANSVGTGPAGMIANAGSVDAAAITDEAIAGRLLDGLLALPSAVALVVAKRSFGK